jgi:hypothetical protein
MLASMETVIAALIAAVATITSALIANRRNIAISKEPSFAASDEGKEGMGQPVAPDPAKSGRRISPTLWIGCTSIVLLFLPVGTWPAYPALILSIFGIAIAKLERTKLGLRRYSQVGLYLNIFSGILAVLGLI